jgi:hypothetical protein
VPPEIGNGSGCRAFSKGSQIPHLRGWKKNGRARWRDRKHKKVEEVERKMYHCRIIEDCDETNAFVDIK